MRPPFVPFFGTASIGYFPKKFKAGLSKFQRAVDYWAERPNNQEDLTRNILNFLKDKIEPSALVVILECEHTCMKIRGVKCHDSHTKTMLTFGDEKLINILQKHLN